ncbi:MAG: heme o synthase [Pseudomonadota bacterium]
MSDTPYTIETPAGGAPALSALAGPRDYYELLKPRVMSLVIFTAFVGMMMAPMPINPALGAIALLAIAVGAGASGALNMWFDADIDRQMKRTAGRPIPAGAVPGAEAAAFGGFLSALSVALLALSTNYVAAALLAFTISFYVVIYSMWLKRATPQNIVIGGAAGALPPVVGWAAVTGTTPLEPWVLFSIIFLWTPPHFWALALFMESDYDRVGIPMMPNVAGERSTRQQIFGYALVLGIAGMLPFIVGMTTPVYAVIAAGLGAVFVQRSWAVLRENEGTYDAARGLFRYSILYLFLLFGALGLESVWGRFYG